MRRHQFGEPRNVFITLLPSFPIPSQPLLFHQIVPPFPPLSTNKTDLPTSQGYVYVWQLLQQRDITSLIPVCSFLAHTAYITRVLLSPDVRHLATCSADHNARIWKVNLPDASSSFSSTSSLLPHTSASASQPSTTTSNITRANGTPGDGSSAYATNPTKPSAAGFPLETSLESHQRWVWDCAFSADSAYLVTACSDHYARLWELGTQAVIRQYNGHHRGAVCVALNDYSDVGR